MSGVFRAGFALASNRPFPKTRRIVFLNNKPATLPGWAELGIDGRGGDGPAFSRIAQVTSPLPPSIRAERGLSPAIGCFPRVCPPPGFLSASSPFYFTGERPGGRTVHSAERISPTLAAICAGLNGFWRNATPGSRMPCCTIALGA